MFKQNEKNSSRKSTKDLQNLLDEYRRSQMDLLDDAYQKRNNVAKCRTLLHSMILKLEDYDYYKSIYPTEKILADIKQVYDDLLISAEKYDYNKLPDDRP